MKAFRVMGRTLKSAYEELFLVVYLSVVWWAGALLIVTGPMATAGLHNVANRVANYKRVDSSYFWEGAKQRVGQGILLYLLTILAPPLILFSITFYFGQQDWIAIFGVLMAWFLLTILMAGQYWFPLFWQQTEPGLKLTIRNSFVLAIRHPLYSILMLLFQLLLFVVSVLLVLPLILLLPGVIAICQNHAMVGLLQDMGLAPEPPVSSGT
jgi:uncharacterized membrane protein YesL